MFREEPWPHHQPVRTACAAFLCAALAACAAAGDPDVEGERAARQCFRAEQVTGFSAVDDRTVLVTTSPRRVFRLELLGPCPDVDWSHRIGIRSRSGGWICRGLDAELLVPDSLGGIGPRRCPVTHVAQLTDDEVAALESRRPDSGAGRPPVPE